MTTKSESAAGERECKCADVNTISDPRLPRVSCPMCTTPRTWPENVWPTAAELADWLSRCTHDERLSYADHSITTAQRAGRCFEQNHDGLLDELAAVRDSGQAVARLCESVINVHANVVMDTDSDRDLHDRAVATFRRHLALLTSHHPRNDETTESEGNR